MASSTISGSVGGSTYTGALVSCITVSSGSEATGTRRDYIADGSGNYTFGGLVAGTYRIIATIASYVYRTPHTIKVDGTSTYSDVNLLPTAVSASNASFSNQ